MCPTMTVSVYFLICPCPATLPLISPSLILLLAPCTSSEQYIYKYANLRNLIEAEQRQRRRTPNSGTARAKNTRDSYLSDPA